MLAIRMQRTGRSGHAQFRVIVQDSRFSPTRGRVVSYLGSYNPHTKSAAIDSEKAAKYLQNGAQPSDTVARLFKKEGIKLPAWVKVSEPRKRDVRNPEKRRSTAPAKPEAETAEAPADADTPADTASEEISADEPAAPDQNAPTDESPEQNENAEEEPAATEEPPVADESSPEPGTPPAEDVENS
jgi:small subunit ribosomal protein S16